jgi:hypothetical protein
MIARLTRNSWRYLGAGLATSFLMFTAGCGGAAQKADYATVEVAEPALGGTAGGSSTATSPAAGTPAAAAAGKADTAEAAPAVKSEGWGDLKGRVVFEGEPPAPRVEVAQGKALKDPTVCAATTPIVSEKLIVDPKTKGVKYAIVYIPQPTAVNKEAESEARGRSIVFDQKGCVFEPHVLAVMEKSPVNIKSSDPVGHNVNVKLTNNSKNFSVPANGTTVFQTQGAERAPGQVVCDVHGWMTAWWYVSKNPYYAVTDDQGNFVIKNAPAGTQKVVVWQEAVHPKLVANKESVNIKANGETTMEYKITPALLNP